MSILDEGTVDIVATRTDSPDVRLVIADHLPWDDFEEHALLLQSKLNTYVAFVQNGQWLRTNSDMPPNPRPLIEIALLHKPSAAAAEFLLKVAAFLEGVGISFEYTVKQDGTEV